jgi:cell wall-associated NlpC family hydrolase
MLVAGSATAEPTSIAGKQAEAARVLAQIRQLDSEVAHAAEAYNAATIELDRIKAEQRQNAFLLGVARSNFRRAQGRLERRVVALYVSGEGSGSALEVILGATSLNDLLSRLETAERVSDQDTEVLGQVRHFRGQMTRRKRQLARARARQAEVVAERAARKREIESRLAERQRLLSTIRAEIERMQAAERARQAELARQARARAAAAAERAAASEAAVEAPAVAESTPLEEAATGTPPPSRHGGVVGIAMQYLGVPYRWGGASPATGFDCSGFTMYVYAQVGVSLPHNAAAQYGMGVAVARSQLQPGDLVFFNGLGHMGLYVGGGQFIHAPHTGDVVKISSLSDSWYAQTYVGARRIL